MKNILLITPFLVCVCALPAYGETIDSTKDPQDYKNIEILMLKSAVDEKGGYSYSFKNDDGSTATQEGQQQKFGYDQTVERVSGSYSYSDANGTPFVLEYTADEHGFRPAGAHLPAPPPIPPEIERSLRLLATAKPFVDDQLYDYKPTKKVFRGRQYGNGNVVHRSRNHFRSNGFSDVTTSTTSVKPTEDKHDVEPETTSQTIPKVSSEVTLRTVQPNAETNNDTVKEATGKITQVTQSTNAASAAIRGEVQEVKDYRHKRIKILRRKINRKLSAARTESDQVALVSAKQSRDA